ncbi:MAG: bifunctional alpha/beta hydrolase/OsmC family protein [Alphaproteobacteria bacterium]|nr:bifunctional alpha/beta hydrolase/OsmC family protein [Alphaproteobacteria bacterium]
MRFERFDFPNGRGETLAGVLDLPEGAPRAFALYAHCFTCGKDVLAAVRIARALSARGIAVLRFDFTGLGGSGGDFADTNFSSNVQDLVAASAALAGKYAAPSLLVGHSLGGAAAIAAAHALSNIRAVATIAAPCDPDHVRKLLGDSLAAIEREGEAEVLLEGRRFRFRRQFLEDLARQPMEDHVAHLGKALLVMHAPRDETVGIENATAIFSRAKHPKSFVSLDLADHLLTNRRDAAYAAEVIAAWADRYLDGTAAPRGALLAEDVLPEGIVRVHETSVGRFQQEVRVGRHRLLADEPTATGGFDTGPDPYGYLLSALGACTSMTIRMYAERKKIPLVRTTVELRHSRIYAADCDDCETKDGMIDHIDRVIHLEGDLSEEQRAKLLEIADKCPVHRTLTSEIHIKTVMANG